MKSIILILLFGSVSASNYKSNRCSQEASESIFEDDELISICNGTDYVPSACSFRFKTLYANLSIVNKAAIFNQKIGNYLHNLCRNPSNEYEYAKCRCRKLSNLLDRLEAQDRSNSFAYIMRKILSIKPHRETTRTVNRISTTGVPDYLDNYDEQYRCEQRDWYNEDDEAVDWRDKPICLLNTFESDMATGTLMKPIARCFYTASIPSRRKCNALLGRHFDYCGDDTECICRVVSNLENAQTTYTSSRLLEASLLLDECSQDVSLKEISGRSLTSPIKLLQSYNQQMKCLNSEKSIRFERGLSKIERLKFILKYVDRMDRIVLKARCLKVEKLLQNLACNSFLEALIEGPCYFTTQSEFEICLGTNIEKTFENYARHIGAKIVEEMMGLEMCETSFAQNVPHDNRMFDELRTDVQNVSSYTKNDKADEPIADQEEEVCIIERNFKQSDGNVRTDRISINRSSLYGKIRRYPSMMSHFKDDCDLGHDFTCTCSTILKNYDANGDNPKFVQFYDSLTGAEIETSSSETEAHFYIISSWFDEFINNQCELGSTVDDSITVDRSKINSDVCTVRIPFPSTEYGSVISTDNVRCVGFSTLKASVACIPQMGAFFGKKCGKKMDHKCLQQQVQKMFLEPGNNWTNSLMMKMLRLKKCETYPSNSIFVPPISIRPSQKWTTSGNIDWVSSYLEQLESEEDFNQLDESDIE